MKDSNVIILVIEQTSKRDKESPREKKSKEKAGSANNITKASKGSGTAYPKKKQKSAKILDGSREC